MNATLSNFVQSFDAPKDHDLSFERAFRDNCSWHSIRRLIVGFIESRKYAIAAYLSEEKRRLEQIAKDAPLIDP